MKNMISVLAALTLLVGCIGELEAETILDQSFDPRTTDDRSSYTLGVAGNSYAQTFTVGVSGKLVEIDVDVFQRSVTDNLIAEIVNTTNGAPYGTVLASQTDSIADIPAGQTWVSFLETPVSVTVGEVLGIELLTGRQLGADDWFFTRGNPYTGGDGFYVGSTLAASGDRDIDFGFKTYVETPSATATPEPSSLAFLATTITVLAAYGWRQGKLARGHRRCWTAASILRRLYLPAR